MSVLSEVWKWKLEPGMTMLELPLEAKVLTVATQYGGPCLWALVDPEQEKESRQFLTIGTGHSIPFEITDRVSYIGTSLMEGGHLVWHTFEVERA